jgi:hypothetical protein
MLFGRVICVRRESASYPNPKFPLEIAAGGVSVCKRFSGEKGQFKGALENGERLPLFLRTLRVSFRQNP